MKHAPRKLGQPIPQRLILKPNGTIVMADGSDPAEYLKSVRRNWKVRGNLPITVSPLTSTEKLEGQALLAMNWGA